MNELCLYEPEQNKQSAGLLESDSNSNNSLRPKESEKATFFESDIQIEKGDQKEEIEQIEQKEAYLQHIVNIRRQQQLEQTGSYQVILQSNLMPSDWYRGQYLPPCDENEAESLYTITQL